MNRYLLKLCTSLTLGLSVCVTACLADDDEDKFADPKTASVIRVEIEGSEPPDLNDEIVKKLVESSRGGKSIFPKEVLAKYQKALAGGVTTNNVEPSKGVLAFAVSSEGKKVGNGQCAVLLAEALKAVKAKRLPPFGPDADYVWGKQVALLKAGSTKDASKIKPGHLLQFRDAEFKGSAKIGNSTYSWTYSAGHHSAIVKAVGNGGTLLAVDESNINGVLTTQVSYYDLADFKKGTIWVYEATK